MLGCISASRNVCIRYYQFKQGCEVLLHPLLYNVPNFEYIGTPGRSVAVKDNRRVAAVDIYLGI